MVSSYLAYISCLFFSSLAFRSSSSRFFLSYNSLSSLILFSFSSCSFFLCLSTIILLYCISSFFNSSSPYFMIFLYSSYPSSGCDQFFSALRLLRLIPASIFIKYASPHFGFMSKTRSTYSRALFQFLSSRKIHARSNKGAYFDALFAFSSTRTTFSTILFLSFPKIFSIP